MNTPHKHADILRAIADGKQVQDLGADKAGAPCYINVVNEHALRVIASGGGEYLRIAPETITVNGVECPKPLEQNIHTGSWVSIETNGHLFEISFAKAADAKTVYDALCKPFKSEGV